MSQQYPGGFITKANVDPTSSFPASPAPGVWTLDQQLQYKQAGVWPSYVVNAIEDVFSTYLYTGNGSTQTITNGIDLSTKGGLVWIKARSSVADHAFVDTVRGTGQYLSSNTTAGNTSTAGEFTGFSSTGFSLNSLVSSIFNGNTITYASWTFRKQAKFFDVVTYTGNGIGGRDINHNLGSAPGCIIVKCTSATSNWMVWHRSIPAQDNLRLNTTDSTTGVTDPISVPGWPSSTSTTQFTVDVGTGSDLCNVNGATYVAYLFAHDAGGFGPNSTDNVISCGSYTGNGSATGPVVTLGYEPQWLLVKPSDFATDWSIIDNMRGAPWGSSGQILQPNTNAAETSRSVKFNPTGFEPADALADFNRSGNTYIYIAIRRGPMRPPTTGTSVFGLSARTGTGANATVTGGQTDDAVLIKNRGAAVGDLFASRLTGKGYLETSSTAAEVAAGTTILQANPWDVMDGVKVGTTSTITNASANTFINYLFRRAPGFFDVVCYTGTGVARTISHNLGVVPELMIGKSRSQAGSVWFVYAAPLGATNYVRLENTSASASGTTVWNNTAPTSSVFTVGTQSDLNANGATQVMYLFATLAGVSKVGSYTGTGALQTINCGFAAGARFVLIKRTDSTGDWWVYDSARGITSGNDPYLFLNSTAAEVTGTNYVDTTSVGFQVTAAAPAGLNASGGTYIFLAIA